MTNQERIEKLAQSAYLAVTGGYNSVTGAELTTFVNETIDWTNQFAQELELETDWNYLRTNNFDLGTVMSATVQTVELPDEVRKLIKSPYRDLVLSQDGAIIAKFKVVEPSQISNPRNPETVDRCTVVNRNLLFSRPFTAQEVGASILTDVIAPMPELSLTDVSILDLVDPYQLLVLGTAKNISLPDLVRGVTSPSFTQKYNNMLQRAVAENIESAEAFDADRESLSFITGVW